MHGGAAHLWSSAFLCFPRLATLPLRAASCPRSTLHPRPDPSPSDDAATPADNHRAARHSDALCITVAEQCRRAVRRPEQLPPRPLVLVIPRRPSSGAGPRSSSPRRPCPLPRGDARHSIPSPRYKRAAPRALLSSQQPPPTSQTSPEEAQSTPSSISPPATSFPSYRLRRNPPPSQLPFPN